MWQNQVQNSLKWDLPQADTEMKTCMKMFSGKTGGGIGNWGLEGKKAN